MPAQKVKTPNLDRLIMLSDRWKYSNRRVTTGMFRECNLGYLVMSSNSTSKINVALGGITPPAPRAP
jgi:hypothetical protein